MEHGPRPESGGNDERQAGRDRLLKHFAETGSLDTPDVPDDVKREYANEHLAAAEQEVARKALELEEALRQREEWRRLAKEAGLDAASVEERGAFTPEERAWFKEGESEERMTLQESWEMNGSLDVDDIADGEKARFAREKLAQLRAALDSGRIERSEESDERLARLEILIGQYDGKAGE